MSYDQVNPTYYQTFQPDTPFHPGAEGWSTAPWMTWGDNPNLGGRRRLATDGLGKVVAISGLGATSVEAGGGRTSVQVGDSSFTFPPVRSPVLATLGAIGAAVCAYHGYKRSNGSIGWTLGWSFFGSAMPILAVPIALAQGFGKPATMAANRGRSRRKRR